MLHTRAISASFAASLAALLLSSAALITAVPAAAAESLTITAPSASSTVSGELQIEGRIAGEGMTDLSLALAPQSLGECGVSLATTVSEVEAGTDFAALIDTTRVPDGVYCIIAVVEGGALSDVRGDIVVANDLVDGSDFELPTLANPEDGGVVKVAAPSVPREAGPILAGVVFALAAFAAAAVAVIGLRSERRPVRR